jgi:serine/threonine-protein kinase HipA
VTRATIKLWGSKIGTIQWDETQRIGRFVYDPGFLTANIELSPIEMPAKSGVFDFPNLSKDTFKGLPGLLADSLPDKFGNLLIDSWLAQQGRSAESFNPVERLCYIGKRGMGALEYEPAIGTKAKKSTPVDVALLTGLAQQVINERAQLQGKLSGEQDEGALREILKVGTSAGGARAKAVIAWNATTGEFRSGQLNCDTGFSHWLIKLDGVSGNADKELADPIGFGRLEYACHLLAIEAGVTMTECRLHEEGGRAHFMTRRFDRTESGDKVHMQSLGALRHYDFNIVQAYSYEQAIETLKLLGAPRTDIEQQVRRAILNVVIRNQDDHVKNIAYLMNRQGEWRLSPAFDVVYAYNPAGQWTSRHQMSLAGKTENFTMQDFIDFGSVADIKPARIRLLVDEVVSAAKNWPKHSDIANVPSKMAAAVFNGFRLSFKS